MQVLNFLWVDVCTSIGKGQTKYFLKVFSIKHLIKITKVKQIKTDLGILRTLPTDVCENKRFYKSNPHEGEQYIEQATLPPSGENY